MGTRSNTVIFDEEGKPLLALYGQYDGGFEWHGKELANFLREFAITNGIQGGIAKSANGMGCLAAQLVKHFKEDVGGFYITHPSNKQEYNYEIRFLELAGGRNNRVSLIGKCGREKHIFSLYGDDPVALTVLRRVQFVYDKQDGEQARWRTVDVTDENDRYITGIENGSYKKFLRSKILDGRIFPAT